MLITISGPAGSGKTTVAQGLAQKLDFAHISAGDAFRRLAQEHSTDLEQFSKFAEEHPDIDRLVDQKQAELVQSYENVVVDGRLSGWILRADIAVWLKAPVDIRAARIAQREDVSYTTALYETRARDSSEAKRYHAIYGIDLHNLDIYDLVIDTTHWDQFGVITVVLQALKVHKKS